MPSLEEARRWKWHRAYLSPEQIEILQRDARRCRLPDEIRVNELYEVWLTRHRDAAPGWPALIGLSIKRRDKSVVRDWRHLQRIKNELVGPEREGVELFPAESRLVDSANQYFLWVSGDPAWRFPFGQPTREVEGRSTRGATQRPFPEGWPVWRGEGRPRIQIACRQCGSTDVRRDAYAAWDVEAQEWVLATVFDQGYCETCESEAVLEESPVEASLQGERK